MGRRIDKLPPAGWEVVDNYGLLVELDKATDFLKAVHQGIDREGEHLYPAFPYASYAYITDEDVLAIKAYLFTLPAVSYTPPANTLSFPYNQRWLMAIW